MNSLLFAVLSARLLLCFAICRFEADYFLKLCICYPKGQLHLFVPFAVYIFLHC